nr:splicing factor U2af large subunit B-like isoform X2 [Physcomitrium patens]XP_024400962.1 splicing factor U2af large subunit B-like isoform X2 [Physcomitrium patens]|eukprot:XP_024400961.1 splicing factor U2af large subunit B-like isoform X2 [Physcomitrella patens]
MTGEIESEGTGVGLDPFLPNDHMIDDPDLAPRKGKGLSARLSALEAHVANYVNYIILYPSTLLPCQSFSGKRMSGFDMAPPGVTVLPASALSGSMLNSMTGGLSASAAGAGSILSPLGQIAGMGFPSIFPFAGGTQATRHARRVYVGGLPPMANEQSVATFFSQVMAAVGGNTAGPGDAVVNVYINQEKRFAFVEMRTVEEASNAMALDGIVYEGVSVRVRRPSDYNPSMAATLGPSQPSSHLNLTAVGLTPGALGGADGPDRIFVGGLPYYLSEEQIMDLLSSFGHLRAFDLVKDRDTGNSKGYGFCVYQDPSVMDIACAALNGLKMGDRTLTVRRASASFMGFSGQPKPDQSNIIVQAQQQIALQKMVLSASGANAIGLGLGMSVGGMFPVLGGSMMPNLRSGGALAAAPETATKVICLSQVVSIVDLKDDVEFDEIVEDMKEECGKYGSLLNVVIPRPSYDEEDVPGIGMVFVEYSDLEGAAKAKQALHNRKFGGKLVIASYYSEDKFLNGDYGG